MGFGIFIHRSDSIYDDSPAERYQFPAQYLGRVESCVGDWIVYYEPRKVVETRGYFGVAKVRQVIRDPAIEGMYLAVIEPGSYLDFINPVPLAAHMASSKEVSSMKRGKFPGALNRRSGRCHPTISTASLSKALRI
jgi:hypothetical protein